MSTNDGAAESRKDHTFRPLRSANVVDNNAANAHDELNDRLRTISEVHRPTSTVARSKRAIVLSPMRWTEFFR